MPKNTIEAEGRLPTQELRDDLPFYTQILGMRLDMIYPADNPRVATFSGHELRLRIEKGAPVAPGMIRILTDDPDGFASDDDEHLQEPRRPGSRRDSYE